MGSERESRGRMSRTGPRRVPQHLSYRWTHWGAQRSQDSVRIMKPIMAWVSLESRNFLGMSGRRWHRNWKRFYPSRYPQAASPLTTSRVMVADQLLPSRATVLHLRLPTDQRCSTAPQAGRQGAAQSRELLAAGFHPGAGWWQAGRVAPREWANLPSLLSTVFRKYREAETGEPLPSWEAPGGVLFLGTPAAALLSGPQEGPLRRVVAVAPSSQRLACEKQRH